MSNIKSIKTLNGLYVRLRSFFIAKGGEGKVADMEINFPRGNSKTILVSLKVNDEAYVLADGETALFTVKERRERKAAVKLQKSFTNADYNEDGEIVVEFDPKDTVNWSTGENGREYYWDFSVKFADETFYTPLQNGVLLLTPALGEIGDVGSDG